MLVKDAIQRLKFYDDDTHVAMSLWLAEDIKQQAEQDGIEDISEEQINGVLDYFDFNHDACLGINWEVISAVIQCET